MTTMFPRRVNNQKLRRAWNPKYFGKHVTRVSDSMPPGTFLPPQKMDPTHSPGVPLRRHTWPTHPTNMSSTSLPAQPTFPPPKMIIPILQYIPLKSKYSWRVPVGLIRMFIACMYWHILRMCPTLKPSLWVTRTPKGRWHESCLFIKWPKHTKAFCYRVSIMDRNLSML